MTDHPLNIDPEDNPWARISEVAARVGVAPLTEKTDKVTIMVKGGDGNIYDLWDVVIAFIDMMDEALDA